MDTPWPDIPRSIFDRGNAAMNACVRWALSSPDPMLGYVEGFRRAAAALLEVGREVGPDYAFFPLAFLWRHHIELALKHLIATVRHLDGKEADFPNHHKLPGLWDEARGYVERCGAEPGDVRRATQLIEELNSVDPNSDGFRYPIDKKGKQSLPGVPELVNLTALSEAAASLSAFLDAARSTLKREADDRAEL